MAELWRFVLVTLMGAGDRISSWAADRFNRVCDLGEEPLLSLAIVFRCCLWTAAACLAVQGRQGADDDQ